jgi:hypothetical protein
MRVASTTSGIITCHLNLGTRIICVGGLSSAAVAVAVAMAWSSLVQCSSVVGFRMQEKAEARRVTEKTDWVFLPQQESLFHSEWPRVSPTKEACPAKLEWRG